MAGNGSRAGSGRSSGGATKSQVKRAQINNAAAQRYDAIRQSSPDSMALKNNAMTKRDRTRYERTTQSKRAMTVARMDFNRAQSMNIGRGSGSAAVRRAKRMGMSPARQRSIRAAAKNSGGGIF